MHSLPKISLAGLFRELWPYIRHYRGRFSLGVVLILVSTLVEVIHPIVVGKVVDVAISANPQYSLLVRYACIFLGLILTKSIADSLQAYVIQTTGGHVTHALRGRLFEWICSLSVGYFDKNPSGRLLTRVINDVRSLSELFTASISVVVLDFFVIVGTVAAMFWLQWKLAAVVLLTFPGVFLIIHFFGKKLAEAYRRVRATLSEINAFLGENIGAISTIQRLSAEQQRYHRFEGIADTHFGAQMDSLRVFALVQPLANVLNGVAMASLLIVGGKWALTGVISVGIFVTFLGYLRNLFQPIRDLVEKYNIFLSAMVSGERVLAILKEKPEEFSGEITEPKNQVHHSVVFRDVSFQYPSRHEPALVRVSLEVPALSSLAIVGPTGSGKSTLIRLLLNFYEPTEGQIFCGGHLLKDWDKRALRRTVGVIHQDIYIFQGTVRENLSLGVEGHSDSKLKEACERAQLWEFIYGRGGLDMPLFEGGSNLSHGERQLLSFARMLVADPKILVLDEATSSIDRTLERKLMEAMRALLTGRTSLVIAHRLSTIQACDSILVLEKGVAVETGSQEKLLQKNGTFARFHRIYSTT